MNNSRRRLLSFRSFICGVSVVAACTTLLSACSKPLQPPSLVLMHEHQAGQVEGAGAGAYSNIMDRLSTMTVNLYPGSNSQVAESIINEGSPSRGVKLMVKGTALAFMSTPANAAVRALESDDKGQTQQTGQQVLTFVDDGTGGLEATAPDLAYKRELQFVMTMTAVRGGEGDVQIFVTPLDKKGKTSVVVTKHFRVLSEKDDSSGSDSSDADPTQ